MGIDRLFVLVELLLLETLSDAWVTRDMRAMTFTSCQASKPHRSLVKRAISSGFSFSDDKQLLVSIQKPLGIKLEESESGAVVVDVDPSGSAARAGVVIGDIVVAVQNASVEQQPLKHVLAMIAQAPRVVNLRFVRPGGE